MKYEQPREIYCFSLRSRFSVPACNQANEQQKGHGKVFEAKENFGVLWCVEKAFYHTGPVFIFEFRFVYPAKATPRGERYGTAPKAPTPAGATAAVPTAATGAPTAATGAAPTAPPAATPLRNL